MSPRVRRLVCLSLVAALAFPIAQPAPAHAGSSDENRFIVRTRSGFVGSTVINLVCAIAGCRVVRGLEDPSGALTGSLFLVDSLLPLDLGDLLTPLLKLLGVVSAERDLLLPLLQPATSASGPEVDPASSALNDFLWRRDPASYYGSDVPEGYLQQPAVGILRLRDAQCGYGTSGGGTVAIIDTGVDATHPALKNVLDPGYDFTRNVAGGDEMTDVNTVQQESAALLDGGGKNPYRCNQESAALLDQESAALLDCDGEGRSGFGHGTMVAGVVHLVAPSARILPLKAFSADGNGYTSDIIRAINFAVQKKAKVLNMSFSRSTTSAELKRALDNATAAGVIAISSAGNDGVKALRWPAAFDNVIGVASTSNSDLRSGFSNYGNSLVWLAAPGEGVITTYPGGNYAAVWGTSFSTPFVAGTTALFVGMKSTASPSQAAWALARAKPVAGEVGYGRLDIYKAVQAGRLLWPTFSGVLGSSCGAQ
jgi:subtilisin family serine protease